MADDSKQLSPRIRDLGKITLYRTGPRADFLDRYPRAGGPCMLHAPHGTGYTLHQLRHSGLTHLAEHGRTAAELQAKSRHRHLATLVHLGEDTAARISAENDDANRRRHR